MYLFSLTRERAVFFSSGSVIGERSLCERRKVMSWDNAPLHDFF